MLVCRDTSTRAAFCLLASEQESCWLWCMAGPQGASSHLHLAHRELDTATCGLHITTMVTGASACTSAQERMGTSENAPSQATVGCWVAASSRTHCQGELGQPCIPGKAQSIAALLPVPSKGLGNFRLKHKNIFKPRYVQSISREGGCKESRERPSGIKLQLKIHIDDPSWLWGFEVEES